MNTDQSCNKFTDHSPVHSTNLFVEKKDINNNAITHTEMRIEPSAKSIRRQCNKTLVGFVMQIEEKVAIGSVRQGHRLPC